MNLSDQQINDFIEAWRKDFGDTLSFAAARAEAERLVTFFTQMEAMLGSHTRTNVVGRIPTSSSPDDSEVKAAWQKTMRCGK